MVLLGWIRAASKQGVFALLRDENGVETWEYLPNETLKNRFGITA